MQGAPVVAVVYLVCGIILFLLGLLILRENIRSRLNRTTGLMLFFAALGALFAAFGTVLGPVDEKLLARPGVALVNNLFYFWELFFPQLLFFALVFPYERPFVRRFPRLRLVFYLPYLFHVLLVSLFSDPTRLERWFSTENMAAPLRAILEPLAVAGKLLLAFLSLLYQAHVQLFSVVNLVYVAASIWLLWRGYRRLTNPRLKAQVRLIFWGIRGGVGLYALAFLLPALAPALSPGPMLRQLLTIGALVTGAGAVAWGIIRYQFMDVKLLVRQSLAYSVTSALVVGLYVLSANQFGRLVKNIFGQKIPLLDVGFIALAIILFQPLFGRIDDLIKRWFIRGTSDFRNLMERFTREIISILDPRELKQTVLEVLEKEVLVERAYLLLREREKPAYLLFAGDPTSARETVLFAEDDPVIAHIGGKSKPFVAELAEPALRESPLGQFCQRERVRVIVPLLEQKFLVGCLALSDKHSGYRYTAEDFTLLSVLANQLTVALANAELYREHLEKQRLEEELALARQIQFDLLPRFNPRGPEFEFASFSQPSRQVGGDYYDYLLAESKVGVVIADASGKGMPAALLVAMLQATLKAEYRHRKPLAEIVGNVNELVASSTSPEKFVSFFCGDFEPEKKLFTYTNAGHNHPILLRADGSWEELTTGGLLLGVFPESRYEAGRVALRPADSLIFYTDGLTDAQNQEEEQFGEERLRKLVREHRNLCAEELKDKIITTVNDFCAGAPQVDDMTLVVLKVF